MFRRYKNLNDKHAGAIADVLLAGKGQQLAVVDFGFNKIGAAGIAPLARCLSCIVTLKSLTLSGNNLADHGSDALAQALLGGQHSLEMIDLSSNGVGDHGAMALRPLLETNGSTLQKLNLNRNNIGNLGAWALFSGCAHRPQSMARVFLKNNAVEPDMQNEIKRQKGGARLFL